MNVLLAQHSMSIVLADHLSPLIWNAFDGEVAKRYACVRTKTSCILNCAVAPLFNRFDAVSAYMRKMDHYGLSDF